MFRNPILRQDYPDPDVIRVEDTYYMISTTMHFMPGGEILRSYDLQNWEHAAFVFNTLDHTPAQCLENGENIYGKGMWAASLKYHKGMFYVCFVANDTNKTYLYRSKTIEGPWEKSYIEGFYHDAGLFFDEDDKVYITYGNRTVYLTELNAEMTGPKEGGLHRVLVQDSDEAPLGYEGSHFYKINGEYYVFLIHSGGKEWFRTQACFHAKSLTEEFLGGEVFVDSAGHRNSGIAQGALVDTPDGKWYSILFQDRGASGRIPHVIPTRIEGGQVIIGENKKMPEHFEVTSTRPEYVYESMTPSGFCKPGTNQLYSVWQWNHEPIADGHELDGERDWLLLKTARLTTCVTDTPNVLTRRTVENRTTATVTLEYSKLLIGDVAGISAFCGSYGFVGVSREEDGNYLVMNAIPLNGLTEPIGTEVSYDKIKLPNEKTSITLRLVTNYDAEDMAEFFYEKDGEFCSIGCKHAMGFRLDHFCGTRVGLFHYATKKIGGVSTFSAFVFEAV